MSINEFATAALPLLIDMACKGTIVLLAALLVALTMRHASAASRHLLWTLTMIALLVVPITAFAPRLWHVPVDVAKLGLPRTGLNGGSFVFVLDQPDKAMLPATTQTELHSSPVLMASRGSALPTSLPTEYLPAPTPAIANPISTSSWIVLTWLGGTVISLTWLLGGWLSLRRLARHCRQVQDGRLYDMVTLVADKLGIRRTIRLLVSDKRAIPMTWGVTNPVVLLPEESAKWSNERLCMVLIHELGHVQRWDCAAQLLGHLARGLYWFHPLAWLAVRQLRLEQEHACDDLVLENGANAPDYAEHLLAVTAGLSSNVWTAPVTLGMSRTEKLHRRMVHLLDAGRNHRPIHKRIFVVGATLAIAFAIGLGATGFSMATAAAQVDQASEQSKQQPGKDDSLLKKLSEVQQKLSKHYITPLDEKTLADYALKGLLEGLKDPYTGYLSADELARFSNETKGMLTGVGAQLQIVDGRITVLSPLDDSPALKAGLRSGDIIDAVDGKSTSGETMAEVVQRIIGPAGSVVKLKVVRPDGVVEELAVTRAEVRVRSVTGFQRGTDGKWQWMLDPEHKVGYLAVQQFGSNSSQEIRDAVESMKKAGMKGLILDLRYCPGGLLEQAIEACKLFLSKGTILTTRGAGNEEKSWSADGKDTLGDFPLVILLNDQTASAAEIVAGSLKDHGRAVLIGSRSFGKGSVQMILKLDEGGALKVTTANHFLPGGRNIQKRPGEKTWGVDPNDGFYIPMTEAQSEAMRKDARNRAILGKKEDQPRTPAKLTPNAIEENHADPQLAAALRTMVSKLTGGEFIKVGKDNAFMVDQMQRLEELRQRREQLQRSLNQLDQDITDLQRGGAKSKTNN